MIDPGNTYKLFIDPLLRKVHSCAADQISAEEEVIDVACGNGSLALRMAQKAKKVTGIDLDEEMISFAKRRRISKNSHNTEFLCMDARDLKMYTDNAFDVSTISMAIHQFPLDTSISILRELSRIASRIIIIDYSCPLPKSLGGAAARLIEGMAGGDHHRNFITYKRAGGIKALLTRSGLNNHPIEHLASSSVFTVLEVDTMDSSLS